MIVDECHGYRGVFGSHVGHVLRRVRRIAVHHGRGRQAGPGPDGPVFLLASATISEPGSCARLLTGAAAQEVTESAAPRGPLTFGLWEPPFTPSRGEAGASVRRSATMEAARLLADLVAHDVRTLAFTRSRHGAEAVALAARRSLGDADATGGGPWGTQRVAAYRSGYLPEDRRQLEEALRAGPILGLATTTALELGINITGLDAVLIAGWPGTRAAVWQQAGRAGREGQAAVAVLIARDDPLDTYLVHHPEALLDRPVEATVLDPGNPYVLAPHLCAAAAELPLAPADLAMFGPSAAAVADTLTGRGMLRRRGQRLYWTRRGRAAEAGLRGTGGRPVKIVEESTGRLVGTVDEPSAHIMVHTGAVYPHQGELYLVTELDLARGVALVEHGDPGYATSARNITGIDVITELRRADWGPAAVHFGEVEVMRQVTSFTRRHPETGQPLGEFPLDLPPRALRTRAVWWTISGGPAGGADAPWGGSARRRARRRAHLDRAAAAVRRLRPLGHRRRVRRPAPRHRPADRLRLRRARGRGGLRRARLRRGQGLAGRDPAGHRRLRVRHGLPVLRPVTQVRQRQRAAEQGRCAAAAGPPAGTAARKRSGRKRQEMRRPPPGGRAGVAVRPRIPGPSSRKA